jgi:hypothetical protein
MKRLLYAVWLACSTLPSCLMENDQNEPAPLSRDSYPGALVVDWTLDGVADAGECDRADATWLVTTVFTSSGRRIGEFHDDCGAFSTSIELDPGGYYAEAVLEDAGGNARTTAVTIGDFWILGKETLAVSVDFPARSFY